jgi:hypothetical protein
MVVLATVLLLIIIDAVLGLPTLLGRGHGQMIALVHGELILLQSLLLLSLKLTTLSDSDFVILAERGWGLTSLLLSIKLLHVYLF